MERVIRPSETIFGAKISSQLLFFQFSMGAKTVQNSGKYHSSSYITASFFLFQFFWSFNHISLLPLCKNTISTAFYFQVKERKRDIIVLCSIADRWLTRTEYSDITSLRYRGSMVEKAATTFGHNSLFFLVDLPVYKTNI